MSDRCQLSPPGWRCLRWVGHHGPCAARREGWFTRHYTWRLPIWFCFISIIVATVFDLACPRRIDAGQINNPRGTLTIVRPLTATDQEAQEGYFSLDDNEARVDRDMMLVVRPKSDLATLLRAKGGRRVMLIITDAEP